MLRMRCSGALLAGALGVTGVAQGQQHGGAVDVGATFSVERSQVARTSPPTFWMEGGAVDGAYTFYRGLGVAVNAAVEHASNIAPGVNTGKISVLVGPRYSKRVRLGKLSPMLYGEALFGLAHGYDGIFPAGTNSITSSANAFGLQVGGAVNIPVTKHWSVRLPEVDYVRSTLPNNAANVQNDIRLAFGVSYRFRRQ